MSGPYPTSVTLVSGRHDANEILFVAGAFLPCSYNSVDLVSRSVKVKKEIYLTPFIAFSFLFNIQYCDRKMPLIEISQASPNTLFWIALDEAGFKLAKKFFDKHHVDFEKPIYKEVRKLNLSHQKMPPYPYLQKRIWMGILDEILSYRHEYMKIRSLAERHEFLLKHISLPSEAKSYVEWMQTVKEIMSPWKKVIEDIQSDWS